MAKTEKTKHWDDVPIPISNTIDDNKKALTIFDEFSSFQRMSVCSLHIIL